MPEAHLVACSGSALLRPDGDDATPTRRAPLPRMEAAREGPIDTRAFALRRRSAPREPSSSLERRKAARRSRFQRCRRFRSPLLRGRFDVLAFGPDGGQEGVSEEREGDVPVPAVPAPYLIVSQAHFSLCLLEADLHSPAAAGRPR